MKGLDHRVRPVRAAGQGLRGQALHQPAGEQAQNAEQQRQQPGTEDGRQAVKQPLARGRRGLYADQADEYGVANPFQSQKKARCDQSGTHPGNSAQQQQAYRTAAAVRTQQIVPERRKSLSTGRRDDMFHENSRFRNGLFGIRHTIGLPGRSDRVP